MQNQLSDLSLLEIISEKVFASGQLIRGKSLQRKIFTPLSKILVNFAALIDIYVTRYCCMRNENIQVSTSSTCTVCYMFMLEGKVSKHEKFETKFGIAHFQTFGF